MALEDGKDLAIEALALPERPTLLVLAAPCSGTVWACECMRRRYNAVPDQQTIQHVAHEQISPHVIRNSDGYRAIMTYEFETLREKQHRKYVDGAGAVVWHLVREPIATVFSMARLIEEKRGFARKFPLQIFGGNEEFAQNCMEADPLIVAMLCVTAVLEKAETLAARTFRVEDMVEPTMPASSQLEYPIGRNPHYGDPPDWDRLWERDPNLVTVLTKHTVYFGYPIPSRYSGRDAD